MKASQNRTLSPRARLACLAGGLMCAMGVSTWAAAPGPGLALKTVTVQSVVGQGAYSAEATVEAVRDTRLSSQVAGRIVELPVKAGDHVQAGQVLVRLDQSVAAQQVKGSQAQLAQAQAMLVAAKGDYERAQHLYKKEYLSKAALDHAEAQYKAVEAQARALSAQASGASVQAAYYTVRAPYAGWVSQVNVSVGDMASPGVPLLALFDPAALRLTVQVPESVASRLDVLKPARIDLPNEAGGARQQAGVRTTVLPALDAGTHSATVRVDMAAQSLQVVPGQFARVSLPLRTSAEGGAGAGKLMVPSASVVERGELTGVYIVTDKGEARLRQVRMGRSSGGQTEVLSGLQAGEKVAVDPVAAAQAASR
ncbi:efflux RND transporter periplasmic adaptor subunit [Aquabacterium sp. CECT 9606]|uniref:efflux RND transporter periplasmic adaptor subunit n=1 Tax=Aquabacterium sp. CECT 9606 TaxID=2845822 RepID=UPI001E40252E|nr:efflux RND transporter periplasmic adaptor subunit [Aquabacterium sp. CECT 9606]CAH0355839.1 Multidrug resistance protein MdtA [Aquabacterium sp. CECT 9606]